MYFIWQNIFEDEKLKFYKFTQGEVTGWISQNDYKKLTKMEVPLKSIKNTNKRKITRKKKKKTKKKKEKKSTGFQMTKEVQITATFYMIELTFVILTSWMFACWVTQTNFIEEKTMLFVGASLFSLTKFFDDFNISVWSLLWIYPGPQLVDCIWMRSVCVFVE